MKMAQWMFVFKKSEINFLIIWCERYEKIWFAFQKDGILFAYFQNLKQKYKKYTLYCEPYMVKWKTKKVKFLLFEVN